jgi:hypothetical protein
MFADAEVRRLWIEGHHACTEEEAERMGGRTAIHQVRPESDTRTDGAKDKAGTRKAAR